nr:penicillin-binding protein 2 [bacterium]
MREDTVKIRINWLFAMMAACFVVIGARLYFVQVIQHEYYTVRAQANRTRHVRDRAQRGRITDCNGYQLATTKPSFSLYITPEDFPRERRIRVFQRLSEILDIPEDAVRERYHSIRSASYTPRKIAGNLTRRQVVRVETNRFDLPGITIQAENIRAYPHGNSLCHVLGYVGEISSQQLDMEKYEGYRVADIIGKSGIEFSYESTLNGQDGDRWVEVDATGRLGRTLRYPAPVLAIPGSDLVLSIDLDLQTACEKYLAPWNGAIIVMDPRNGDVLALVSRPGYDPNGFASGMSSTEWQDLNTNPHHPLLNRAIQFQAPPGSVFKVVSAISGLRSGTLTSETPYFCNGAFKFSDHVYRCWNQYGHGMVDLPRAIEGSCNVYFYQAGVKTGIDLIAGTARDFGLGDITGIELPNEKSGFIPDRDWKMKTYGEEWWPGETISVSIGQGGVTTTPMQLACMMAMTANRGIIYRPRLVRSIVGHTSRESREIQLEIAHQLEISDQFWDPVIEGLRLVVAGEHGTARGLRMREMSVAGKTGTAQVISSKALKQLGYDSENEPPQKYWDHNWFAGFGPVEDPGVVVVIVIENGGSTGAREKITIARKIFLKWYELNHAGI